MSAVTGRLTLETPYYRERLTAKYEDCRMPDWVLFLYYLSVIPYSAVARLDTDMVVTMNSYNLCKETGTLRNISGYKVYTSGKARCFKYNDILFYRDYRDMFMISKQAVLHCGRANIAGEYLGPQRELTKARYLFGVGNIDKLIAKNTCGGQSDIYSICKSIYD